MTFTPTPSTDTATPWHGYPEHPVATSCAWCDLVDDDDECAHCALLDRDTVLRVAMATIGEATGCAPILLDTGGGCEVLSWNRDGIVWWLSAAYDACMPTSLSSGWLLTRGPADPDHPEWTADLIGRDAWTADDATIRDLVDLLLVSRPISPRAHGRII